MLFLFIPFCSTSFLKTSQTAQFFYCCSSHVIRTFRQIKFEKIFWNASRIRPKFVNWYWSFIVTELSLLHYFAAPILQRQSCRWSCLTMAWWWWWQCISLSARIVGEASWAWLSQCCRPSSAVSSRPAACMLSLPLPPCVHKSSASVGSKYSVKAKSCYQLFIFEWFSVLLAVAASDGLMTRVLVMGYGDVQQQQRRENGCEPVSHQTNEWYTETRRYSLLPRNHRTKLPAPPRSSARAISASAMVSDGEGGTARRANDRRYTGKSHRWKLWCF